MKHKIIWRCLRDLFIFLFLDFKRLHLPKSSVTPWSTVIFASYWSYTLSLHGRLFMTSQASLWNLFSFRSCLTNTKPELIHQSCITTIFPSCSLLLQPSSVTVYCRHVFSLASKIRRSSQQMVFPLWNITHTYTDFSVTYPGLSGKAVHQRTSADTVQHRETK